MIPTRQLETRWGVLHVVCARPDRVTCSTSGQGHVPDSVLQIDGQSYTYRAELFRCSPADAADLGYEPINDIWCADHEWGSLTPTVPQPLYDTLGPAHKVVRYHVLPTVAAWLRTADGLALLQEGASHWRTVCQRQMQRTERVLVGAWQRLQQISRAVSSGSLITVEDEQFLQHPLGEDLQELRNRLDLELVDALKAWLPERDRQPAVNALTDVVIAVLHHTPDQATAHEPMIPGSGVAPATANGSSFDERPRRGV